MRFVVTFGAFACALAAVPVEAAVRLDFNMFGPVNGFFSVLINKLPPGGAEIPLAQVQSCIVDEPYICQRPVVAPGAEGDKYSIIQFGYITPDQSSGSYQAFAFNQGEILRPGSYVPLGGSPGYTASLTVTDVPGRGGYGIVPEPATWTMLIFGIAAVGASLRMKRRTDTHVA